MRTSKVCLSYVNKFIIIIIIIIVIIIIISEAP